MIENETDIIILDDVVLHNGVDDVELLRKVGFNEWSLNFVLSTPPRV